MLNQIVTENRPVLYKKEKLASWFRFAGLLSPVHKQYQIKFPSHISKFLLWLNFLLGFLIRLTAFFSYPFRRDFSIHAFKPQYLFLRIRYTLSFVVRNNFSSALTVLVRLVLKFLPCLCSMLVASKDVSLCCFCLFKIIPIIFSHI